MIYLTRILDGTAGLAHSPYHPMSSRSSIMRPSSAFLRLEPSASDQWVYGFSSSTVLTRLHGQKYGLGNTTVHSKAFWFRNISRIVVLLGPSPASMCAMDLTGGTSPTTSVFARWGAELSTACTIVAKLRRPRQRQIAAQAGSEPL